MSATVELVDADALGEARGRDAYLRALLESGSRFYVDNADVEMRALEVDGQVLPIAVAGAGGGNADVCSPYSHYVRYTLDELAKRHQRVPRSLLRIAALPFATFLQAAGIDRAVYVNNWLFTTNPSPRLSSEQVERVTARVAEWYPGRAIVFRSINPHVDRSVVDALRANGYRLVRSRRVYLLDPASVASPPRDLKEDLRLLESAPFEVVREPAALVPHASRLADLYRDLYLVKQSRLNPAFNERFFTLTLEEGVFEYRALVRDGRVDAFISHFVEDGVMTGGLVGYDRALPQSVGLYRMAFALMIAEGLELGVRINLSAGAGRFKRLRGAAPVEEFDAVYDRHLPAARLAAWAALAYAGRAAAARQ